MELQLVSFKQAKALKKLGFPQDDYYKGEMIPIYDKDGEFEYSRWINKGDCFAPSLELVAKWLRKERNIELLEFIHLEPNLDSNKRWNYRVETTIFLTYEEALSAGISKAIEILKQ